MTAPEWSVLIALVSLFVSQMFWVAKSIWWASSVTTTLEIVRKDVSTMMSELKEYQASCFTKSDANRELAIAEKEHKAMWHRIDEILNSVKTK